MNRHGEPGQGPAVRGLIRASSSETRDLHLSQLVFNISLIIQLDVGAAQSFQTGDTYNCMNNSNPPPNPSSPRVTLKLKTAARKSPRESKTPSVPRQQNSNKQKPGAHWSDEYKERMQADMDALTSR